MEVKNRKNTSTFQETEIPIRSFNDGVNFFTSIGMKPYLYMNRTREILDYKGLKIFIDDIDLLGLFVEIEVQELSYPEEIMQEFLSLTNIEAIDQPLYGDIFLPKSS